jgi:hypothetical protein
MVLKRDRSTFLTFGVMVGPVAGHLIAVALWLALDQTVGPGSAKASVG